MPKTKARTLHDLRMASSRAEIDAKRVSDTLNEMRKRGREHWEYERDFCLLAKLSHRYVPVLRERFAAHVVLIPAIDGKVQRYVWFGNAAAATAARKELANG